MNCFELTVDGQHKGYFSTHYKAHKRLMELPNSYSSWEVRDTQVSANTKLDLDMKFKVPAKHIRISNLIGALK